MRDKLITVFLEKNWKLNLSAIRDPEGVRIKHIQDSLELLKLGVFQSGMRVADIGTGGGFPLMPLAISLPELQFVWIDSIKKKTVAVNEMLTELEVNNAKVIWTRIEEYRWEDFDLITARAVAYSDKLLERAFPLLKKWGSFLLMKELKAEERSLILDLCKKYHLSLEQEHGYQLFEGDIQRVIYVLRKK